MKNYAFTMVSIRPGQKLDDYFDPEKKKIMIALCREEEALNNDIQNRRLRLRLTIGVFCYVCIYTGYVVYMIDKSSNLLNLYHFDKEIAITLLSTTSINIIGLLAIVVKYLFPVGENKENN